MGVSECDLKSCLRSIDNVHFSCSYIWIAQAILSLNLLVYVFPDS